MSATAIILGICQLLFMAAIAVGISFNGLVGKLLAPSPLMATFPFLFMMGSTAALTLFMPKLIRILGYKKVFLVGALAGAIGSGIAAFSIDLKSFVAFCFGGFLMGIYQASALYYRFAAADAVQGHQKSTAIAWVLSGGIVAALIGPILGSSSLHLLSVEYLGSYLMAGALAALALPIILISPIANQQSTELAPVNGNNIPPNAFTAMLFCISGYSVMLMVMLASPLAMSGCGFHAADAAGVIQWHLLGMFAPSLIVGKLISRVGTQTVALAGVAAMGTGCVIALLGSQKAVFHVALLMVGIGWNFMYMSGSTLLTQIPNTAMRSKLQAINEFVTFSIITVVSGLTGWLYESLGWEVLLYITLIVLLSVAIFTVINGRQKSLSLLGKRTLF